MTRQEHLEWAKTRAKEYLDKNEPLFAIGIFITDLRQHPELTDEAGYVLLLSMFIDFSQVDGINRVQRLIDDIN